MPRLRTANSPDERRRGAVHEILPGKLYQRGQILTWQREKKRAMMDQYGIRVVVNFWPKLDSDLSEVGVDYLHLPAVRSEEMMEPRIDLAARWVAQMCERVPVLVLCEAGLTRSVYFCVLVVGLVQGISLKDAQRYVQERLGRTKLKPGMIRRLQGGWKRKGPGNYRGPVREPAD